MPLTICDFCSHPVVTARYHCDDFIMAEYRANETNWTHESVGDWAACSECELLIDAQEWDKLAERVTMLAPVNLTDEEYQAVRGLYSRLYRDLVSHNFRKAA